MNAPSPSSPFAVYGKDEECRRTIAEYLAALPAAAGRGPGVACVVADADGWEQAAGKYPAETPVILLGEMPEAMGSRFRALKKPFRLAALGALAEERLPPAHAETTAIGGGLALRLRQRELFREADGACIALTEKEQQVLLALAGRRGEPLSRETLLAEIWRYQPDVTTHTLETHLSRLRAKLAELCAPGPSPLAILSVEGGYCLR